MKKNPLFKKEIIFLPIFFGFGEDIGARRYYMFLCGPDYREDASLALLRGLVTTLELSNIHKVDYQSYQSQASHSITGLPSAAAASPTYKLFYVP